MEEDGRGAAAGGGPLAGDKRPAEEDEDEVRKQLAEERRQLIEQGLDPEVVDKVHGAQRKFRRTVQA